MKAISSLVNFLACLSWGLLIVGEHAFSKNSMPKVTDTDMIELHHLRSFPLLAVMSDAGSFKFQTSGIALRSTETSTIIVLEFKPLNTSACFLPIVNRNINDDGGQANSTLSWDKRSTVSYDTYINPKYWMQSTFLGIINGVVYRNYLNWVEDYLTKSPGKYFIPQSICSSAEEESCFTLPSTGDTFLAASLSVFAELFVKMHAIIPPRASEVHLLSSMEPRLFKVQDSLDLMPRDLDPAGDQKSDDSSSLPSSAPTLTPTSVSRDFGTGSISSSIFPFSFYFYFSSTLSFFASSLSFSTSPSSTFASSESSLRGSHPRVIPAERETSTKSRKHHAPTMSPISSTPTTSPTLFPTTVPFKRFFPSNFSPSLSPTLSSTSPIFDTVSPSNTPSRTSSDVPTTMSSIAVPVNTPIPSNITAYINTTIWYEEKGKEDDRFNTTDFQDTAVTEYFVKLIGCMRAYTLEYFADALKSCLKDGDGFIHLDGSQYYHIRPRHPFALKHDYWQAIPTPSTLDKSGQDISDIVISLAILVITIVGLTAALWKLKMFDWAFVRNHRVWKKRITAKAPSEGGYSSIASELPMYRVWGGGMLMHSDVYNKLQTEDLDEDWSSGGEREKRRQGVTGGSDSDVSVAGGQQKDESSSNDVRSSDVSGDEVEDGGEQDKLLAGHSNNNCNGMKKSTGNRPTSHPINSGLPSIRSRSRSRSGSDIRIKKVNKNSENGGENGDEKGGIFDETRSRSDEGSKKEGRNRGRVREGSPDLSSDFSCTTEAEGISSSVQLSGGIDNGNGSCIIFSRYESCGSGNGSGSGSGSYGGIEKQRRIDTGKSYSRYYESSSESDHNSGRYSSRHRHRHRHKDRDRDGGRDKNREGGGNHRLEIPDHRSRGIDISHSLSGIKSLKSPSSKNSSRTNSPDSRRSHGSSKRYSNRNSFNSIVNYRVSRTTPTVPVPVSVSVPLSVSSGASPISPSGLILKSLNASDRNNTNFDVLNKMTPVIGHGTGTGTERRLEIELGTINIKPLGGIIHIKPPLSSPLPSRDRGGLAQSPSIRSRISPPPQAIPIDNDRDRDRGRDRVISQSDDKILESRNKDNNNGNQNRNEPNHLQSVSTNRLSTPSDLDPLRNRRKQSDSSDSESLSSTNSYRSVSMHTNR